MKQTRFHPRLPAQEAGINRASAILRDIIAVMVLTIAGVGAFDLRQTLACNFESYFTQSGARASSSVATPDAESASALR